MHRSGQRTATVKMSGRREHFRREAKLARKVTHRNVARTFDIAQHRSAKFLSMELVVGRSLAAELGKNRRPATNLVRCIVEGVTSGLSAAHAIGFHQETEAKYLPRLELALDTIVWRARDEALPVRFVTAQELLARRE